MVLGYLINFVPICYRKTMQIIRFLIVFISIFLSNYSIAQQDSIRLPEVALPETKDYTTAEFYNESFGVFDTLKVYKNTLYLSPVALEPKLLMQDTTFVASKANGVQKIMLSSYEVTRRTQGRETSYFLIEPHFELFYDRQPRSEYHIPFDALNSERTDISFWEKTNVVALDINQGTFHNWNAGGVNSVSGILKLDMIRRYEKGRFLWNSELKFRYGLNKQDEREVRKTDDVLSVNSTFGYKTSVNSNWYHTAKFTLNTQVADGFSYPDISQPISRAFAPAYVFLGIGAEYSLPSKGIALYLSPITSKSTFVLDKRLANLGAFGLPGAVLDSNGNVLSDGKRARYEVGIFVSNTYTKKIMHNVKLEHKLTLYTDYLNNFGNIDVDWQLQLQLKVNNFINTTLTGNLLYDDDIKNAVEINGEKQLRGARVQIKQLLAVGVTFSF